MKKSEIKKWLKDKNEDFKMVYLDDGVECCANPNMGYALIDEIFAWQDELDDIDYSNEGLAELYLLVENILDTLELRLMLNPAFVKEMNEIHNKIESEDESDFVRVYLPERSFFDLVNNYCDAKKIGDVLTSCGALINYVQTRISDIDCDICDGRLWIKSKNNKSLTTDLISQLLEIDIMNIDDMQSIDGIWSIHLYRR